MTESAPIACSLAADDLRRRLAAIAEIGADSLVDRRREGDRHVLRFRAGGTTRRRLDEIVAAEADCCSFLDLALVEDGDELVLTIAAPSEAASVAESLALAFGEVRA
jgi:hypothetical protein